MKKIILLVFASLFFLACKEEKKVKQNPNNVKEQAVTPAVVQNAKPEVEEEFISDFDILIPTTYRDWEGKNPAKKLNQEWVDLFFNGKSYELGKAKFNLENGYDECSGDSTQTINSQNKTLLYLNLPELKLGKIQSVSLKKNKIWPKEKYTFEFNSVEYQLRAEGNILDSWQAEDDDGTKSIAYKVEKYKLFLSSMTTKEKLILYQSSFNDTFVELLFVGDIDRDQKPDFIFSANRDYEENRVLLFLSSKAKTDELIKKVAEIAVQFDC